MTEKQKPNLKLKKYLPIVVFIIILVVVTATFFGDIIKTNLLGIDTVETLPLDEGRPGEEKTPHPAVDVPPAPEEGQKSDEQKKEDLAKISDTANATVFYEKPYIPKGADGTMQLINKVCGVSQDYVPENLQLTKYRATDRDEANQYMIDYAAKAMDSMLEAAQKEGYTILVTTAYRSYGMQSILYNNYVKKDGQAAADRYSARPGTSEHQSGLAADLTCPEVNYKLTNDFGNTEAGKWLAEHAWEYGFIKRYLEEGEPITGYMHEAWHYRYVGKDAAKYITENNLTLEEYIAEKY